MSAHGKGAELRRLQLVLNRQQALEGHVGKDMFGPALGGRQLDVVKARAADARDGFLNGIAMIAVGVDRDDALFHGRTSHSLTRTARPVSEDSMLANTARMAGSTLSALMPS